MLVFRNGNWKSIEVALSDPILTQGHRQEAAAFIASRMERGYSLVSATADAEKMLYTRLYPELFSREQHSAPKNYKEKGGVKEEA
jgi:hypothetical protein